MFQGDEICKVTRHRQPGQENGKRSDVFGDKETEMDRTVRGTVQRLEALRSDGVFYG